MVNGKSFVIASEALDGMDSVRLSGGLYLNRYDGLSVSVSKDGRFALIGDCWSVKEGEDPGEYIAGAGSLSAEDILGRENYWCGRYVLVLDGAVYMDAAGTMNVFYNGDYVSNSLNLIREMLGLSLKKEKIYLGISPDFVPGAKTRYSDVKRLLPSMVYHTDSGEVTPRALLPDYPLRDMSEEERLRVFVEEFASSLKNLDKRFSGKRKLIACTGGHDSRSLLAVSEYAGLHYDTFTLEHDQISEADVDIPVRLSGALGRKHFYIKKDKKRYQSGRLSDFDRHTCNYVNGADRQFYGYGQFEELKSKAGCDVVVLRSAIWEIATEYYKKYINGYSAESMKTAFPLINNNRFFLDSVNEWLDYAVSDDKNRLIGEANRIFWEMREGCWASSIEQSFDIYDGITSVQPVNCRRLLSLLMGFEPDEREEKLHQEKIANYACPSISDIPYDYQINEGKTDSAAKKLLRYIEKASWLLFNYGPGSLIFFMKTKLNDHE